MRALVIGAGVVALSAAGMLASRAQQIDFSHGGPIGVTAEDGLEWQQNTQQVIAHGKARATRGTVTVAADRLVAHYRKKATDPAAATAAAPTPNPAATPAPAAPPAAPPSVPPSPGLPGGDADSGSNEIYRVEALGSVHIDTPTDHATGEHATYDIDQAVMLMTGNNLHLATPSQVLTARDSMEYWTQKHMAVARGDAVVVTNDAKRIAADVLVAYTDQGTPQATPATQPVKAAAPASGPPATPAAPDDPLAASGKLKKVEAWGHVSIRTPTDIVTGDRAVYVPDTQIARVGGDVRITRGQNQLNGVEAEVNLKTGISRLLSGGAGRVQGLVVPADAQAGAGGKPAPAKPAPAGGDATPTGAAHP